MVSQSIETCIIIPMHKLILLVGAVADSRGFNEGWPEFLHHAEEMPGLIREAAIRVNATLFGDQDIRLIHELFFETQEALRSALISPQGRLAGGILQRITGGQVTLLTAEHREDDIENLRKYRQGKADADSQ